MRRHLRDGELYALLDGEAGPLRRLRSRLHLRRCAGCASRAEQVSERADQVARLLAGSLPPADVEEAWRRVVHRASPRRRPASLALAIAAVVLALLVDGSTLLRPAPTVGAVVMDRLDRARGEIPDERERDTCCTDFDGDAEADDGVVTVFRAARRGPIVILYEDSDRSGRFSAPDSIRSLSPRRF